MAAQFARAPHRGGTSAPTQAAPNAALLIDFDNVTMGIRSDLSKELKSLLNSDIIKGKVAVQRAYADWRRYPQYIVPLAEASVDLIFAPAYGSSKKNATDIRLAIDALELVFTRPEIGTFILLSGDSDFSSLVLKLKEYGKYVIGVGIRESASDLLVQNCDEYYSYSVLSGLTKEDEHAHAAMDPWELVEKAVLQMAKAGDVMRSDRLKQVMLELDPNFNEKDLGYSKFSKFLSDAVSRERVHLRKLDNGQWEVAPAGAAAAAPQAAEEVEPRESREDGRRSRGRGRGRSAGKREDEAQKKAEAPEAEARKAEAAKAEAEEERGDEAKAGTRGTSADPLAAAYALLRQAVEHVVGSGGGPARDSDVKRRMLELEPGWDESALGFSKFSRFLRQAHDAEVINLQKAGDGIYEVLLPDGSSAKPADDRRGRRSERSSAKRGRAEAKASKPEPEAKDEAGAAKKDAAGSEPAADAGPKTQEPAAAAAPAGAEASEPAPRAESAGTKPAASPAARGALAIGFRRGTRGRGAPAGPPPLLPGQTVKLPEALNGKTEPAGSEAEASESAGAATAPATEASPKKKSSRSRSRRGRSKKAAEAAAAEASPKAESTATAAAAAPELAGLPVEADAVTTYLTSRYKGVGKKTAEAVIEAFGAENVFRALHTEADKVREVLGGRRAETLLSAWQADLEHRRAEAAAVVEEAAAQAAAEEKPAAGAARSGSRKGRGSSRKSSARSKSKSKTTAGEKPAAAAESADAAGTDDAPKAEAAAEDEGTKKSGGRSRGRRGGRKRTKAKAGGA